MPLSFPGEFVGQTAWAKALGVSVKTFRQWRALGLIPTPLVLPGRPRWRAEDAVRVTARLGVVKRRLFEQRPKALGSGFHRGGNHGQFGVLSRRHAVSVAEGKTVGKGNSLDSAVTR